MKIHNQAGAIKQECMLIENYGFIHKMTIKFTIKRTECINNYINK